MRIRVGTLNAWALPEPFSRDVTPRMQAIGAHLADLDLDVMAFQELWTDEARSIVARAARRAGFAHQWHSAQGLGAGGGLLIVSRYPIEAAGFEPFRLSGHVEEAVRNGEYLSGKGVAFVRIATPAGGVRIVDTHLHARYSKRASHRYISHRTAQVVQIAAATAESAEPLVMVGDFNFHEGEDDYRVLLGLTGARDLAAVLDRRQTTCIQGNPYRRPKKRSQRKDYVFVRNGAALGVTPVSIDRVYDATFEQSGRLTAYSDHAGLVAELEIGSPTAPAAAGGDPRLYELARSLLAQGRVLAESRDERGQLLAAGGVAVSALSGVGAGALPRGIRRRTFLRGIFGASILAGLAPGLLYELTLSDEVRAFREASETLSRLAGEPVPHDLTT
jgi:sphingomyelin phosphodiesterase 2